MSLIDCSMSVNSRSRNTCAVARRTSLADGRRLGSGGTYEEGKEALVSDRRCSNGLISSKMDMGSPKSETELADDGDSSSRNDGG